MKRTKIFLLFWAVVLLTLSATASYSQTAYGISIVKRPANSTIVEGYSSTYLDSHAGIYYDPEIISDLYRTDDPEAPLSSGRHIGYSDIVKAEVFHVTSNHVAGKTYCTFGQHFLWSYFYNVSSYLWMDPFRYSFVYTGNPPWGGFPFSYFYVIPRRHRIGYTHPCITLPLPPPTPSPTPLPTVTPTPTGTPPPGPCDSSSLGCASTAYMPFITPVRPTGTSTVSGGGNTTQVSVCIEPAEPNRQATLRLINRPQHATSGGHVGHTGTRPLGKLAKESGVTGSNGCFTTTYSPSHISGMVGVNGTISGFTPMGADILIRVDGLFPLGTGNDHKLIGQTVSHPENHYGTGQTNLSLRQIATDYRSEFYPSGNIPDDAKVAYNDISLNYGGKFDLNRDWANTSVKHGEHREGINCDVRSNNIPTGRWVRFNQIMFFHGSTRTHDETGTSQPHWHTRFEYGNPRVVERTPHSFVEDAFDGALSRESSQAEYEVWLNRITLAKNQGSNELVAEAKLFQKEIFVSSEYVARNRTQAEFVEDVYWTHLSREPSSSEVDHWVNFMSNLPPAIPANRRRSRMLDEFHLLPEFEEFVLALVDPTLSGS